jgi:uncharacterized membrane protein YdbT with pleckstrin-like domain
MHLAKFVKQKSNEQIEYVLHRHPVTFLPEILLIVIMISIPFTIRFIINSMFPSLITPGTPVWAILVLFFSGYVLVTLTFFYTQFVNFFLDFWVVTNDRIIDVEQKNLFARTISELGLVNIQDVTTEVHGFFATLFDYGDVIIKTASDNQNIIFENVPHPNKIRVALIDFSDREKQHFAKIRPEAELKA